MNNTSHTQRPHPCQRALHLVDLENLAGRGTVTEAVAVALAAQYLTSAAHRLGDLIVVASSHRNGFAARTAFPSATVRWRSGRNGADLALLEALEEFDLTRFSRLIVGSGDGIFAGLAAAVRWSGLAVDVVGRPGGTATSLCAAANSISYICAVA